MSQTIDERVVKMAFENSGFDKNVSSSIDSIDKLKKSLKFDNAAQGFADITSAANKVNLQSIADSLNTISSRFSLLGIAAITVFTNIVNAAFNAGKQIAKALTIDPIKMGFDEYELKLNSVQTIMAGTGEDLKTVTKYLDELNKYADLTIYSFSDMTQNIGKFTNAGVSLDQSVKAIKGVANVAAVSGANANEASRAMYNFAQALSSGYIKLIDWKSIELANMGTVEFKQQLIDSAVAMGTLEDAGDGMYKTVEGNLLNATKNFNDTLTDQWLNTEVLVSTLERYSDATTDIGKKATAAAQDVKTFTQLFDTLKESAQSGWAQTWEIIIGDFDEAKKFLTDFNNWFSAILSSSADARNALLQGWKDLGGRAKLIKAFENVLNGIVSVINPITKGMREIFPPITAQRLYELTDALAKFTEKLILNGEGFEKLKKISKGIFAVFDIVRMALSAVFKGIFGLTSYLDQPIRSLTDFLVLIADYIINLRDSLKETDFFSGVIAKFGEFISGLVVKLKEMGQKVVEFFSNFKTGLGSFKGLDLSGLKDFMSNLNIEFTPLKKISEVAGKVLGLIWELLKKLAPAALKLGTIVAEGIGRFVDGLMESLGNFEPERVFDILNGGLIAGLLLAIKKFIEDGTDLFGGVTDILDGVKDSLEAWQNNIKADTLLKIAGSLAILTAAIWVLASIDQRRLTMALGALTVMFIQLGLSLKGFESGVSGTGVAKMGGTSVALVAMALAILTLAGAVRVLAKLDPEELTNGLVAMFLVIKMMKMAARSLEDSSFSMISGALALIIFAGAIRALGISVSYFGKMNTGNLTQGLIGVGVLLTELALFLRTTDLSGMGAIKAVGILILATAINLLAIAVAQLAKIDDKGIAKGLLAITLIFTELALFMEVTAGGAGIIVVAAAIGIISLAMLGFAAAMVIFAGLEWEGISKGLITMAGALSIIGIAAYLIPPTLAITAVGLVIMAAALVILAAAMRSLGEMSWDEIGRGLVVLTGALLALTTVLLILGSMPTAILGAAALILAAGAMLMMVPALKALGSMSLEEIGLGLLALVGAFAVLGISASLLTPVIPSLLALGAAMLLLGAGVGLLGAGVFLFSAGLAALAVSGTAGVAALVTIVSSIIGLVPLLVKTLGRALLALIDVLVEGAPKLLEGVILLLNILLNGLLEVIPKIVEVVGVLIDNLISLVLDKTPDLIEAGYTVLKSFLEGIRANLPDIVNLTIDIVTAYINTIADRIPDIVDSGWNLIIAWIDGMRQGVEDHMPDLLDSIRELALAIIEGIVKGIIDGKNDAIDAIKELGELIIEDFKKTFGIKSPSSVFIDLAKQIILGLVNGIKDNVYLAVNEIVKLGTKVIDTVKDKITDMYNAGKDLVKGLANGVRDYISTAVNAASNVATSVLDTISGVFDENSPSRKTFESGKNLDLGLAGGILNYATTVTRATNDLGAETLSGFNNIIAMVTDSMTNDMDFEPTITPVLDLSAVTTGSQAIDSMLSNTRSLNLSTAADKASGISTRTEQTPETDGQTNQQPSTVSFVQNNYSPKELSRYDIYRQTRNQIRQLEEVRGLK